MPDDWTAAPYARVYVTLARDHPAVWQDDGLLAWYVRLLVGADRWFPAPAPWPRSIPQDLADALVGSGAIDPATDGYQVHGMARLRALGGLASIGGRARAAQAARDEHGRMLAGANRLDQPAGGSGSEIAPSRLVPAGGGDQRPSDTHTPTTAGDPSLQSGSPAVGTPVENARATQTAVAVLEPTVEGDLEADGYRRELAKFGPDDARCLDVSGHLTAHHYFHGIGWKCLPCDQAEADRAGSFRSRVDAAGGPHF
jgi:hypothetical protein